MLYESIGIDVIVSLVANEISPLCEDRLDLVLQLKNSATKALLSIMESREDSRIADQILLKMDAPVHLVRMGLLFARTFTVFKLYPL